MELSLFDNEFVPPQQVDYVRLRPADEADSAFLYALQIIGPMLHESSRSEFAIELNSKLTVAQQIAAWRARFRYRAETI